MLSWVKQCFSEAPPFVALHKILQESLKFVEINEKEVEAEVEAPLSKLRRVAFSFLGLWVFIVFYAELVDREADALEGIFRVQL